MPLGAEVVIVNALHTSIYGIYNTYSITLYMRGVKLNLAYGTIARLPVGSGTSSKYISVV